MPSKSYLSRGTNGWVLRDATDFAPATGNDLREGVGITYDLVQLDTTGLADSEYRKSALIDFSPDGGTYDGVPPLCSIAMVAEFNTAPTAGDVVYAYMAWSEESDVFPGGVTAGDAAYTGDNSNADDAIKQCDLVGVFVCTNVAQATAAQRIHGGQFVPKARYGVLILRNESGAAFYVTDAAENHIAIHALIPEGQ